MSPGHAAPLQAALIDRPVLWRIAVVIAGSAMIAVASWISAPMYPVPMTMQSFVVMLLAGLAGARLAAAIVLTWLALAALGLPLLADGAGGLAVFEGPTSGYLAGFLVAAFACGWLTERPAMRGWLAMLAIFVVGHALILALGWARLSIITSPLAAWDSGVAPFLPGSVIKSIAAVIAVKLMERVIRSFGR
jgi:biotin transport system substrate-specific component